MPPNEALRNAVLPKVYTKEEQLNSFPKMLEMQKAQLKAALPAHINADRMARIALTCYRQNPQLANCEPASVFACVIQASQLGLEPGLNGRAYLIPYKKGNKYICTFVPGWKGLVELANRTGRCTVWTGAVFQGDDFDFQMGDSPFVKHKSCGEDDEKKITHVYAIGRIRDSDWPVIEIWNQARVVRHRDRFNKVGTRHYSYENWEMYARKVPLLQVLKYMPSSPELERAMAIAGDAERGAQDISLQDAIDGTFSAATGDDDVGGGDQAATGFAADALIKQMQERDNVDDLDADASLIPTIEGDAEQQRAREAYKTKRADLQE